MRKKYYNSLWNIVKLIFLLPALIWAAIQDGIDEEEKCRYEKMG